MENMLINSMDMYIDKHKVQLIRILIWGVLLTPFFWDCSIQKNTKKLNQSELESINVISLENLLKNTQKENYLYKKLMEQNIGSSIKGHLSVSRKEILYDFGTKYTKNDTIIIVESYTSIYSSYTCYIFTSSDRKILKYNEEFNSTGDEFYFKKEVIESYYIIDAVLSGQLMKFKQEVKKRYLSPQTDFIVSTFYKNPNGDYDFSYDYITW